MIKAHNQAQSWQTKRQILSLFANDFSRAELQKLVPGLSKWRIDQARQHATQTGRGQPVLEQPIFRCRIDPVKIDHFIEYILRPELLQDVPFGTKTLKLDSGEKIIIPAVIRTLIPSRIIQHYRSYCTQQEFEPASERSMYRMLQVCSASMQKSLQGLDNVTADGTEASDSLVSIVETLSKNRVEGQEWRETVLQELKDSKRYLKTDFKIHVGRDEHCTVYTLSDPNTVNFREVCHHDHDAACERCSSLRSVFTEIEEKLNEVEMSSEQKARIKFELQDNLRAIKS